MLPYKIGPHNSVNFVGYWYAAESQLDIGIDSLVRAFADLQFACRLL